MENLKRRKSSGYLERIKKQTDIFKTSKKLVKSLDNESRGVFKTHSEIYDEAILRKYITLQSRDFHKKLYLVCLAMELYISMVWQASEYTSGI